MLFTQNLLAGCILNLCVRSLKSVNVLINPTRAMLFSEEPPSESWSVMFFFSNCSYRVYTLSTLRLTILISSTSFVKTSVWILFSMSLIMFLTACLLMGLRLMNVLNLVTSGSWSNYEGLSNSIFLLILCFLFSSLLAFISLRINSIKWLLGDDI